jgi:RNA-directed DNA polymerase
VGLDGSDSVERSDVDRSRTALRNVIEPIFERDFAEHSYGFRPNRGCKDALRRVDQLVKSGYRYVVDADVKGYFDTIPHDRLLARVAEKISDGRLLDLIALFLQQGVMSTIGRLEPTEGTPQGAVISPLLSNIYLDPLDHLMAEAGYEMVRYADDFVILCRTLGEAEAALEQVKKWTTENGLTLHPEKTHIADTHGDGFEFLGYHLKRKHRWPRKKSLQKFKDTRARPSSRGAATAHSQGREPLETDALTPPSRGAATARSQGRQPLEIRFRQDRRVRAR